jgi:hypothetical protein
MRAGQGHGDRFIGLGGPLRPGGNPTGAWVTYSGSIMSDSRAPFIPFWEERRQTEHAAPWSTQIPCFRPPHRTKQFPFLFQPVARVSEERLRQLNSDHARPKTAGDKMAISSQVSSPLYGIPTGTPQTQKAAFMANPEVLKCR